jgi:hypothetical protein
LFDVDTTATAFWVLKPCAKLPRELHPLMPEHLDEEELAD